MGDPFSAGELIDGAVRETGLDDFGRGAWRDGLEALIESSLAEADLNLVGLGILKSWSHRRLANRLRVIDWIERHPEVRDERIERPIFVLGMLRTGTTILCELLAQDPANRPLMKWEGLESVPPPRPESFASDPRIAQMVETVEFQMSMVPGLRAVHYEPGDGPTECVALLTQAFRAQDLACGLFQAPSYVAWYHACDLRPAYDHHRLSLQLLQSGGVRGRWSLKAPGHMHALDALLAVYPDARLIVTHRDPLKTVPSSMSLSLAARADSLTNHGDRERTIDYYRTLWMDELALMTERMMAFRDREGDARFFDLQFRDFMADPIGCVRTAYAHFGEALSKDAEAAMQTHLASHPRGKHGRNAYHLETFGLDRGLIRERFAGYVERFGVPEETVE